MWLSRAVARAGFGHRFVHKETVDEGIIDAVTAWERQPCGAFP